MNRAAKYHSIRISLEEFLSIVAMNAPRLAAREIGRVTLAWEYSGTRGNALLTSAAIQAERKQQLTN